VTYHQNGNNFQRGNYHNFQRPQYLSQPYQQNPLGDRTQKIKDTLNCITNKITLKSVLVQFQKIIMF